MTTELTVFSDYWQIHLLDSASSTQVADQWNDSALFDYLALDEDAIGIRTGVDGDVTVTIDVLDAPPADDTDAFDTVTECSLRIDSSRLRLASPAYDEHDGDLVTVPSGWLRLRVSLLGSPDSHIPSDEQHIRVQCWLADRSAPVLVKGWNPETLTDMT